MDTLSIGVDIAKDTFDAAVWLGPRGQTLGRFPNHATGQAQFCAQLSALQAEQGAARVQVTLEPSGGYERALAGLLHAQGFTVALPNPAQVRQAASSHGRRAKTDAQDALALAQFGAERRLHPWQPLPTPVATLAALLERQAAVEDLLQQEHNRQQTLAVQPGVPAVVTQSLAHLITTLTDELRTLANALKAHFAAHADLAEELALLRSVPGVGARTAPWLLVLLHRWSLLTDGEGRNKALVAYLGLDPKPYQSGTSVRRHAGISRQGSRDLRRRLYLAAFGGVRHENALRAFYQRLRGRQKPAKLALVAAARKLLVWAWAVFRSRTPFDAARAGYHPEPVSA
jgi:transposase